MSDNSTNQIVETQERIPLQRREEDRILFFDNIRYLMVLLVVVIHVACGYSNYTTWWAVNDDNSTVIDFILRALDIFLMPTLFFIAGFFALPSLHKNGAWMFVRKKMVRLGIPCLVGVALLGPVRMYIHDYSRGLKDPELWKLFMMNLDGAASLRTGFIHSTHQFNHIHFWFISLLLVMFILFAMLHQVKKKLFARALVDDSPKGATQRSVLIALLLAGSLAAVWTLSMHGLFVDGSGREPWVVIASILQFQPTRVGLYIICFSLGIFAFHKKWFTDGHTPGHLAYWALLSLALWGALELILTRLLSQPTLPLGVTYVTLRTWLVFTILVTLIAFGGRYWQSASKVNRMLAKNSYTIYLIHFFFVLLVQLLLYKWWDVSIHIKFIIGCIASVALTYIASEYAVRRYPRLSIAGMAGLFAMGVLLLNPG